MKRRRREKVVKFYARDAWGLRVLKLLVQLQLPHLALWIAPRLPVLRVRMGFWGGTKTYYGRDVPDLRQRVLGKGAA